MIPGEEFLLPKAATTGDPWVGLFTGAIKDGPREECLLPV